ncbi:hypothetical protein ABI59_09230 [Acidobacteria bacterium Mor1]|nr:hypothetical protein ABI59_09230 [Acidobacteria bacterium Mor1]
MRNLLCLLPALVMAGCATTHREGPAPDPLTYPATPTVDQIDTYHGVEIADPYRWLEDDQADQTKRWIEAQQVVLEDYVEEVPRFDQLENRVRRIREFGAYATPVRGGEHLFYTYREPGAQHPAVHLDGPGGTRPLLPFEAVHDEPGHGSAGIAPSRDGKYLAWAGTDPRGWGFLDVVRVADGEVLQETIEGVAGNSAIWDRGSRGFFYQKYGTYAALMEGAAPAPQIRYHRVGTDPAADPVVYERPDRPSMLFNPRLSSDLRYLIVHLNDGSRTHNQVVYLDLDADGAEFTTLIEEADASYRFEANQGTRFLFRSTLDAPRSRVIAVDLNRPEREHWETVVPQQESAITAVSHIGGRLVLQTTAHARPVVEVWSLDGRREKSLDLPSIGLLSGFADRPDSDEAFYRLNSLVDPGTIYRVDLDTGDSEVYRRMELAHDPDDYEIRQVFYESGDGTRVPMFLAHRKDVPLRGENPLYMYGYGHGGWVAFPWFQPFLVEWMDLGGTYALPGLRGGGEYGLEWQEAGTRLNKPNTLDDFIAAAEWLVDNGYTRADRLVANGGSASGVVPAAAVIRRPDLFGAAVIDFPFLDMLRYHHFTTVKGWTRGYGSADDPEEFAVLHGYSPLHRIEPETCYPAVLTIVGEKDTATVPMHGYKFTAALQAASECGPSLLKFVPGGGHYSYGTTPAESAHTEAEILAFLVRTLGMEMPDRS